MTKIMRIVMVGCAVLALAVAGCGKDEDKDKGSGKSGTPAGDKGGGGGAAKGADLAALEKVQPEGWTLQATKSGQTVTYNGETEIDGKKVGALAQAGNCEIAMMCPKLDVEEFKKNAENLKAMMSNAIKADPNTVFEIAAAEIAGRKVITVYSYGHVKSDGSSQSNHALNVFWNDGKNMITLMLSDRSMPTAATFDEFKAAISRAPIDKAAETLMKGFEGKI